MARKKLKNHIVFSILATVGVVAVWRGIWIFFDSVPYLNEPLVAIFLAIIILIIAGIYFKKINFW